MATIANAIQITNTTATSFNTTYKSIDRSVNIMNESIDRSINTMNNSIDRSVKNVNKRFQFLNFQFNKSIDTKSFDQLTSKFTDISKSLETVIDNFKDFQSESSKAINSINNATAKMTLPANPNVNFPSNPNENIPANTNVKSPKNNAGVGDFVGKIKDIGSAVVPKVKAVMDFSDKYSRQNSDLQSVNDGSQTQAELQNKVYATAQNSRTSYDSTVSTVSTLGALSKDNFKSNDEAIYFTELMNKAFSGLSTEDATAGIQKLTNAMVAGKLKGQDLVSVMQQAPALAEAVARYTKQPVEKVASSEGNGVSADVLKNAVFDSATDINAGFADTPATFEQIFTTLQNSAMNAFGPILQKISEITSNTNFQTMIQNICNAFSVLGSIALWAFGILSSISGVITDNWSFIAPIIFGITTAMLAYKAATLLSAAAGAVVASVKGLLTGATIAETAAQNGLNLSLLACPLTWIVLAIIAVIAAIVYWVQSVGGLQVAWLIVVNALMTAWDWVKIGFFIGVYWIIDLFNNMMLKIKTVIVNIQNFMGDMRVNVLTIIQDMVNGAIGLINSMISALNHIPGVSISAISQVDFADNARSQNEAEKAARNAELSKYQTDIAATKTAHENDIKAMMSGARAGTASRQAEIDALQAKSKVEEKQSKTKTFLPDPYVEKPNPAVNPYAGGNITNSSANTFANNQNIQNNVANTAANTSAMNDTMEVSEEDLKYMRDIAEQEAINKFTTSEIKVDMTNHNNINSNLDLDGVISYMEQKVNESLAISAEGGAHY